MALKDIFTMVKADKYTADGREELIKAQEAEVEDKTYQIGEISQKTGLQKTANGWVKPKSGKAPGAKTGPGKTPATENKTLQHTSASTKVQESVYKDIKNNGLEDYTVEEIAKEYGTTRGDAEAIRARLDKESKPASSKLEQKKAPKPTMQQYMKAKQDIKQFEDTFKKQNEQYEARQRMGEGASAMSPLWGLKPNDYKNDPEYQKAAELVKAFEAKDSAPRVLTGDTKICVRK